MDLSSYSAAEVQSSSKLTQETSSLYGFNMAAENGKSTNKSALLTCVWSNLAFYSSLYFLLLFFLVNNLYKNYIQRQQDTIKRRNCSTFNSLIVLFFM